MKKTLISLMVAALTLLCSCAPSPKANILVVSENGGHHKPFTDVAVPWLDSISASRGFTVTVINNMNDVNAEFLKNFNAVIQLDFPPYTWPEAAQEAFIEYVEKGLGGYIEPLADGTVHIESTEHPLFKGVDPVFTIPDDEWYTYDKDPRDTEYIHVLASVDEDSYRPASDIRMGDHPVIWTNTSVKARNIYFQFGHSPKLLENDNFKTLLLNAIDWVTEK